MQAWNPPHTQHTTRCCREGIKAQGRSDAPANAHFSAPRCLCIIQAPRARFPPIAFRLLLVLSGLPLNFCHRPWQRSNEIK